MDMNDRDEMLNALNQHGIGFKNGKLYRMEAWQNIEGALIPEWLQGRGSGTNGKTLHIIIDKDGAVLSVAPNQYVVQLSDGSIVIRDENKLNIK